MKSRNVLIMLILGLSMTVCVVQNSQADSMGTAFTYQGRFVDSNSPAVGSYDFEYKLYDALTGGTQCGNAIYKENLDVIDGYFTTELDFGSDVYDGSALWLQIGVRPGDSSSSYTALNPRQELTPSPYAIHIYGTGSGTTGYIAKFNDSNDVTDSVIYESAGIIGIGTTSPCSWGKLTVAGDIVFDSDETDYIISARGNGGAIQFRSDADNTNRYLKLGSIDNNEIFHPYITIKAGKVGIGTTNPQGFFDVNGPIYQRGSLLHADYVFEPDYELESVDEHSQFMWQHGHLKAIPKAEINTDGQEVVELGAHRRGMVEELEKAHIYIEQLNERIKILEEKLAIIEAKEGGAK